MRLTSTDDVTLELHDFGGEGPTLLIAHATGFCAGAYRPLAAALAGRFHVWGLDFRAHGDSTGPSSGDLNWSGMIDDVLAVTDEVAPDTGVFAIGHSMGGACLLGAEVRRPGTIERAYLFEPIIFPAEWARSEAPNPLAVSARRRRAGFPSRLEALGRYASRPPLGRFRADVLSAYVEHGFAEAPDGTVTLKCRPEDEAATFEAPGKLELEQLGAVATPTVVAHGTRDLSPGPADFAPLVVEALTHGEIHRYEHLGHFGPLQDPDTIADDAAAFLLAD